MGIKIGITEEKRKFDKNGRSAPRMKYLLKLMVLRKFLVKLSSKVTDDRLINWVDKCSNM